MDPYQRELESVGDREVTVDRDGAPSVQGQVIDTDNDGCVLQKYEGGGVVRTFIAYRDIRGVTYSDWDMD